MMIKDLAYAIQSQLDVVADPAFKRAHAYELLASAFGFHSYAAFCVDTALTRPGLPAALMSRQKKLVQQRCTALGYPQDYAEKASLVVCDLLAEKRLGAVSISSLIRTLRRDGSDEADEHEQAFASRDDFLGAGYEGDINPVLLDGLKTAASRGHAVAHYALALMDGPDDEEFGGLASEYWYKQSQQGASLSEFEQACADAYVARVERENWYWFHLKEAGRLGCAEALLDLAEQLEDPTFFERQCEVVDADPMRVAEIAENLGRMQDARKWLTVAAEEGDTDAMRSLVDDYERDDLVACWKWVYLSELLDCDLRQDHYQAIDEHGRLYDDDVGGPAYVGGYGGVELPSLDEDEDMTARQAARELFEQLEPDA